MSYYIAQALGLLSVLCCILQPQMKKKWQMLAVNIAINTIAVINILVLDGFGSGMMVCAVGVLQAAVMLAHVLRGGTVSKTESIIFLLLYVGGGLIGLHRLLDALPFAAALFNMFATFQRSEQRTRVLLFINAAIFAVYYGLIGSTALLGVLCTMASSTMAIWRNRDKNKKEQSENCSF